MKPTLRFSSALALALLSSIGLAGAEPAPAGSASSEPAAPAPPPATSDTKPAAAPATKPALKAAAPKPTPPDGRVTEAAFDPMAKPPSWTQKQKTSAERGVNPCNTKDPGFGDYDKWDRSIAMGQMLAPKKRVVNSHGEFDLMIHFHGHEAVRKEWVQVMHNTVLVGIDLGIGSGPYETAFAPHGALKSLVESVERAIAKRSGNQNAHVRRLGLSAWSAGYGAVQNILADPWGREHVDTVVLLDGLHCGYQGKSLNSAQLKPFLDFSARAADGERLMVVTHSSIIPPGYASTTETANFLISKLGGHPTRTQPRASDPMGLELISRYTRGAFHVRGFAGNDTLDHCAQIGLFRDVLKVHVLPRWKSRRDAKR